MNLRKIILYLVIVLFGILFYSMLNTYTTISQLATNGGVSISQLVEGSGSAFMIWLQFPIAILVLVILVFLTWWDESLTDSYLRLRDKVDSKPINAKK